MSKWFLLFLLAIVIEIGLFIHLHFSQKKKVDFSKIENAPELEGVEPEISWQASYHRLIVLFAVIGIFGAFVILALFIANKPETIRDLVTACIANCFAILLGIASKSRFQLSEVGIAKLNMIKRRNDLVFKWEELKELKPTSEGLKYTLKDELKAEAKKNKRPMNGYVPVDTQYLDQVLHSARSRLST